MKNNNKLDEKAQKCLNLKCGAILFISGKMGPGTEDRGVDRDIHKKHDEKGDYIECPKCGAKHKVKYDPIIPGEGIQWSIDGLRD
jgi:DNA-directed RNA polymerase subunit RPC12/RpoP